MGFRHPRGGVVGSQGLAGNTRRTSAEAGAEGKAALRPCGTLEADVPVVRVHFFPGVVRVGHDAYRTRQRRILAEGALVILVDRSEERRVGKRCRVRWW